MAEDSKIVQINKGALKRILKVGDLFAVGYGDLGSSIYYALGITALYALGATPISLAIAGFVFACTALTYAELSSLLKEGGGSASFSRHAFNDLVSFIAGWGLLLDFIVTIAISSYSISPYLSFFAPFLKQTEYKILFTVGVILVLLSINIVGTRHSTKMSWMLTSLTLFTQILIIVLGAIFLIRLPTLLKGLQINVPGLITSPTWGGFWKGTAMAMVAYTGIESMVQLSQEAKQPAKTVPRAIMLAMGTLIFVYLGLSIIALSAMSPQELSTKYLEDPIAGIVEHLPHGRYFGGWVGLLAAIILFVASNAGLIGSSRLSFKMGENYQLPRFVYKVHPRFQTPVVSLTIFAALAILIILWSRGEIAFLADLYNFGAMLAFCAAHLSLLMLRIRRPNARRPFKVPGNIRIRGYDFPISAIIGCLVTFAVWILVVITKPEGRYLGFTWILLGLVMYFYYRNTQRIKATGKLKIEKIQMPHFRKEQFQNILVSIRGRNLMGLMQMACEVAKNHKAALTVVHVIDVPFSMTLEADMEEKVAYAEQILKEAEAIAREFHVPVSLKSIQSRSVTRSLSELVAKDSHDLVIAGVQLNRSKGIGETAMNLLKSIRCPVWFATQKSPK